MVIGAAKIVLDFWGNEELRDKKHLIAQLTDQLHKALAVHLTEVEDFDDIERCVLGVAFCASEMEPARARMKKILEFIDTHSAARVVSEDSDFQVFK